MWQFNRPTTDQIERFLGVQRRLKPNYQTGLTAGFCVDFERVQLGVGEACFHRACRALREWRMFPAGWTTIFPANAPLEVNQVVAVVARVFGVWWLNACQITSVAADQEPNRRFGFVYATLPGHVETGEEEFLVEWDSADRIWYQIRAVSRPRYWLTRLAYPLTRSLQRQFRNDSQCAMQNAVSP